MKSVTIPAVTIPETTELVLESQADLIALYLELNSERILTTPETLQELIAEIITNNIVSDRVLQSINDKWDINARFQTVEELIL
jgi:hypothetical protein